MRQACGCECVRGKLRLTFDLECEIEYEVAYHCGSPRHNEGFGGIAKEVMCKRVWLDDHEVPKDAIVDAMETYARDVELT